QGIIAKMNLIPYNVVPEFDYRPPCPKEMMAFKAGLDKAGIHATIRTPRGKDVHAACGQLRHLN
ncbi:MAG: 23S rRNA (adenine(2503)-C(2))-methyltransferase RlmN, partial [Candidatus Omnitrophica bacterium]|nr:23S rRNA (adenine(2503)-C(2))-methyltransferase RlmN [Candidatus Omnitrophota bacterium]